MFFSYRPLSETLSVANIWREKYTFTQYLSTTFGQNKRSTSQQHEANVCKIVTKSEKTKTCTILAENSLTSCIGDLGYRHVYRNEVYALHRITVSLNSLVA